MSIAKYDAAAADRLFDDALARRERDIENRATIDGIMATAHGAQGAAYERLHAQMARIQAGASAPPPELFSKNGGQARTIPDFSCPHPLDKFRPDANLTSMPPREFVGPGIGKARLFPRRAISLFTALGGTGKTTALIAMAAHIAAGKAWATQELEPMPVLMTFVEEDQEELNRKFAATTHDWDPAVRALAADNTRLVSLVGRDPRLTTRDDGYMMPSELVAEIAGWAKSFGAGLIVLDHLQGFADGDLNHSDTATALAQAENFIVDQTGAAVVLAAHVNKGQINAETVDAGITTGSLAFENAARQVTGAIPIPKADVEALGIDDPENIIKLIQPKNSYGPAGQFAYLRKEYVPEFHTVRVVPFSSPRLAVRGVTSKADKLRDEIVGYVSAYPGATKNKLDGLSGLKGKLEASKEDVRRAVEELIDDGALRLRPVSKEEKTALGLPQQTTEILEAVV